MEHKKRKARPHDSGKEMITVGIQTNVEIVSSSPARGKYSEKQYERLFIRESGMRARDGKMTYIRRDYHNRIRRIIRVIGHDRLSMSAYIDHVLTLHFGQSDEAIKSLYEKNYEKEYQP